MNKTRRLFVGIPLSDALRTRLVREMATFPKEATLLTAEENLHVTVFFLGFVHEEDVVEMCARVGEVCEDRESFELSFSGIRLAESEENPKSILLAGEASDELRTLREDIEKAFASFITEKKIYRPHVTLAKIKKQKWLQLADKPVIKDQLHIIEQVDSVAVFESLSIDGKRRYVPIDTFPLL